MEMTPSARAILGRLFEARTGQSLSPGAERRVEALLTRIMVEHRVSDFDTLTARIAAADGGPLADEVVEAMLNNETYFYRDGEPFRQIRALFSERLSRRPEGRHIRVWSAGCSTGQELYTLAMVVHDLALDEDAIRAFRLLGTDISRAAVARASAGVYTQFEIQRGLPVREMLRWFGQDGATWRVRDALRERTEFRRHNLLEPAPAPGYFDIIFCRNVLIYFDEAKRRRILGHIERALAPDGALVLGAGETVMGLADGLAPLAEYRGLYGRAKGTPRIAATG